MRNLEQSEFESVSGGWQGWQEDEESIQDPVITTGTPTGSDPYMVSISMDTILKSGQTVADFLFGTSYEPARSEGEGIILIPRPSE